jgi:hypothetical protein
MAAKKQKGSKDGPANWKGSKSRCILGRLRCGAIGALAVAYFDLSDLPQGSQDDDATDKLTLQKRVVLHHRAKALCDLRMETVKEELLAVQPGQFMHVEPFWLERYMDAFSECEDWSWMLKMSPEFRSPSSE